MLVFNVVRLYGLFFFFLEYQRLFVHSANNFEKFVKEVGATMCRYLVQHHQLPRHFHRTCGEPTCSWDDWQDALINSKRVSSVTNSSKSTRKERVVLSYGHNGFGNQLWQHTVAFMIAESLGAHFYIAIIPDVLSPDGVIPPNTWNGIQTMDRLLPKEFLYEHLSKDSYDRLLCDNEPFYIADRPKDWRNGTYASSFKATLYNVLDDPQPRCLKFLGYFQNYPICRDDVRRMWTTRMFQNFTMKPGPNDISIYLRCLPRHYHFNDKLFYETILNRTKFDNVWLFQAPECPTRIGDNPARDGLITGVFRLLISRFKAKRWPTPPGEKDDTVLLLHDLAGLAQSKKLILPVSSWAFWGGLLSNATEIHVNAPPHHPIMNGMTQYYYHNEKGRQYFGKLINQNGSLDIIYNVELSGAGKVIKDLITPSAVDDLSAKPLNPIIIVMTNTSINTTQSYEFSVDSLIQYGNSNVTINLNRNSFGKIDLSIRQSDQSSVISTATTYRHQSFNRTEKHSGDYQATFNRRN